MGVHFVKFHVYVYYYWHCVLLCRIKSLLHLHYCKLEGADPFGNHVPWDQVIMACTDHMLSHLNSRDLWVSGILHSDEVAWMKFSIPTRWMQAQAETSLSSVERPSTFRKRYGAHQIEFSHPYTHHVYIAIIFSLLTQTQTISK